MNFKLIDRLGGIKNKKIYFGIFLFFLLVFLYFSFLPVILSDTSYYYSYISILRGDLPLSEWSTLRGPTMPIILYLFTILFGESADGLLMGTFLFYLIFLFFAYKLLKEMLILNKDRIVNTIICILFIVFIIFNPLIIGYYHVVLTEFIATTVAMALCFMSYKWIDKRYKKEKLSFLLYTVLFILLTSAMWFLKQPFISVVLFPLLLATIISVVKHRDIKNVISKILVFLLTVVFLFFSIFIWDKILTNNGVNSAGEQSRNSLAEQIVKGLSNVKEIDRREIQDRDFILENKYLSKSEKEEIFKILEGESEYQGYSLYNVLSRRGDIRDVYVLFQEDSEALSFSEAFNHLKRVLVEYPISFFDSYYSNYLTAINIYTLSPSTPSDIYPVKIYTTIYSENINLGYAIYSEQREVCWWVGSGEESRGSEMMGMYEVVDTPNRFALSFLSLTADLNLDLFKVVFLLVPFLFVFFLIKYTTLVLKGNRNRFLPLYEILIILFGFSFLHIMAHVITGAIIDRYVFVAYPATLLGVIFLIKFVKITDHVIDS